jgi:putative membrane protein
MTDWVKGFISEADQQKIEACVHAAESRTRGEIVVMVTTASARYPTAGYLGATAFSLPAAVALTPLLGGILWAGPSNLWVFLAVLIPLFLGFHEAVKRIPVLKRRFVSAAEMEEEVREAAHVQFFRNGLYRTAEETGVLFYVSVFERRVWVIGDRGINARIPEAYWQEVSAGIVRAIRAGRAADGICRAVTELADVLEANFPVRPDDRNELKNVIIEDRSA